MVYRRSNRSRRSGSRRTSVRRRPSRRVSYTRRPSRMGTMSRRAQRNPVCTCSPQVSPGDKFALVQADPFEPKYFGAKIPDSSTIPSIPTPIQYNYSLNTDATTQPAWAHCWAFYPTIQSCNIRAGSATTSTWSWTASTSTSNAPVAGPFQQQFEAFRPVAHAIRLSCPLAPTSTTGFVHIALATETMYSNTTTTTPQAQQLAANLSDLSGYTFYKRVTLASLTQSPLTLINKWTDETAFRYSSPLSSPQTADGGGTNNSSANQFHIPLSWGTLLVAVEGGSSVTTPGSFTPLQAEIVLHTENIPQKSSALIGSTAAAYSSGVLNAVSQAVANTDFAHTEAEQERVEAQYMSELRAAGGEFASGVASTLGRFARTAGQYAGMAGLRYAAGALGVGGVNNRADRLMMQ